MFSSRAKEGIHLKHLVLTVTAKSVKPNNFRTAELELTLGTSAAGYQKRQREENTGIAYIRHVWPMKNGEIGKHSAVALKLKTHSVHVRLLGPSFKTGQMEPYDRQHPKRMV